MRTFDFAPFYRSTVGFDRLFSALDQLSSVDSAAPSYPPYNIARTGENAYRVSLAVAGFRPEDLSVTTQENRLVISGEKAEAQDRQLLYRGIATRAFRREFTLADFVKVVGARFEQGMLMVDLVREVPEAMKPRRIEIAGGDQPKAIEQKKAA